VASIGIVLPEEKDEEETNE